MKYYSLSITTFEELSTIGKSVPRINNVIADTLANAAAKFTPMRDGFSIEIIYRHVFLDNITNLYVFNDDQKILDFTANVDVFMDASIDEEENDITLQEEVYEHKGNPMLKGVVMVEKLFDLQNHFWGPPNTKTQNTHIIQHVIPIQDRIKPFHQKLMKVHPMLEPLVQKDLKKLLDACIIFKFRHSTWASNLILVQKKYVEIQLCIDF